MASPKSHTTGLIMVAIITQLGLIGSVWVTHSLSAGKTEKVARVLQEDSTKKDEKLEQIHVLVNSRLTQALDEIKALKERMGIPVTEQPPK